MAKSRWERLVETLEDLAREMRRRKKIRERNKRLVRQWEKRGGKYNPKTGLVKMQKQEKLKKLPKLKKIKKGTYAKRRK